MRDELLFDKIEAYLRGKLPPAEAAAFEAEIAAEPELAALVKTHRFEQQGLEWLVERDLKTKMDAWEREVSGSGSGSSSSSGSGSGSSSFARQNTRDGGSSTAVQTMRVRFVRRWWAVGVAAALFLAVFGWWLLQPQADIGGPSPVATAPKTKTPTATPPKKTPRPSQKPSAAQPEEDDRMAGQSAPSKTTPAPQPGTQPASPSKPAEPDYPALAATYYREQDFIPKNGGTTGHSESPGYGQALDSYKSGKYTDVEKLLKPTLKNDPDALKTKELLAHSLYRRGQYAEALTYFRQLATSQDKTIAERSEWAMALTLLHQMPAQKTLLIRTLDKILAKPGHGFYNKAKALRERVK